MNYSEIDWFLTWKLFHYQFCCIYLALAIPIRLIVARRVQTISVRKRILYIAVSSIVLALASTWFPVIPIIAGAIFFAKHSGGESLLISAPVVGVLLGTQNSGVDAIIFRILWKNTERGRLGALVVSNLVNAMLAVTLGLVWAVRHMPDFIAALN